MKCIAISTLAINQTLFWHKVALAIERACGLKVILVVFDYESYEYLSTKNDIKFIYPPNAPSVAISDVDISFLNHERWVFGNNDNDKQIAKISAFRQFIAEQFQDLEVCYIVQELGGFTSNISLMLVAQDLGVPHYFIEPSFIKGRFFLTDNVYRAPYLDVPEDIEVTAEVEELVEDIIASQSLVVPDKDKAHYQFATKKIFNLNSFKRFFHKINSIFFKKQYYEFGYPLSHAFQHVSMAIKTFFVINFCVEKDLKPGYAYFPMHVPNDAALTIRSPQYRDQLHLVERICEKLPSGMILVIKEHPAKIGSIELVRLLKLKARFPTLKLAHPSINNHVLLSDSAAIITINSKSGFEGVLHKKPVCTLGDAFYRNHGCTLDLDYIDQLDIARLRDHEYDFSKALKLLQAIKDSSYQGELYSLTEDNINTFSQSLLSSFDKI